MRRRQRRHLARDVFGLPVQGVAHQRRGFVVQVVSGHEHVVPALRRSQVREVPLREAAHAARRSAALARDLLDREPLVLFQIVDDQLAAALLGERLALVARLRAIVLAGPERDVEAGRVVAHIHQDVPQGERVLPAGHADEQAVGLFEHRVVFDRFRDLVAHVAKEAVGAERRVRAGDFDLRRLAAALALRRTAATPLTGPAGDHRTDLDLVGVGESLLAGEEVGLTDDEDRLRVDLQAVEEAPDG